MENETTFQSNLERTILGAILFDEKVFEEIREEINDSDFTYPEHRHIYQICEELYLQNSPLDFEFIKKRADPNIISDDNLVYIIASNPIASVDGYVASLKEATMRREIRSLIMSVAKQIEDENNTSQEILSSIEQKIYSISTQGAKSDFRDTEDFVNSTLKNIIKLKQKGNQIVTGIPSGFIELDKVTTGFNKGNLIIVGARPSMGKTSLILNMAQHILKNQNGVAIFSLEMPAEDLTLRMLSFLSSIPLQKVKTGDLTDSEIENLSEKSTYIKQQELFIDDGGNLTLSSLRSKLLKLKRNHPNINIAIIDYLQLMRNNTKNSKERYLEISDISRGLKILARELQMPIIALSQLNRGLESRDDKKPLLSDIRESGSIEQDADIILFLYRDDVYRMRELTSKLIRLEKEGGKKEEIEKLREAVNRVKTQNIEKAEILIAKNRNGETKDIEIQFNKHFTRFENVVNCVEDAYSPTQMIK